MRPVWKSDGMSDRKMGTKSAAPSAMAPRSGGPVKTETEKKRGRCAGSTNGAGPAVCKW
jgi:hypothetical protein